MANRRHQTSHHNLNGPQQEEVVVVMVPLPAQGHLNQLLQLSRLILSYHIPVHYVAAKTHNLQAKLRVHGWDPLAAANIHFHDIEIPPFHCPSPNPNSKIKFPSQLQPAFDSSFHLQEPVSSLLRALSCKARKVIVIHDSLMASVIQEARLIPNAESYSFHSVSAFAVSLYTLECLGKPIEPNETLFPDDIPSLEGCFTTEFLDVIACQYNYRRFNDGCLYNTCKLVENSYMDLLAKETVKEGIKNWALGPFNPVTIPERISGHFCLEWLDKQARNSVIYVSFGTTTALSDEQIRELAIGLRQSNQKFIWVIRDADKADVFNGDIERGAELLPEGYEESVNGMGLVVRDWAPQLEILAHPATGGFMSHCGWNSCMESISMGVPIAAWPMHSDQPRNTVLITKILKIGIVVKEWARRDEIVTSTIVKSAMNKLMATTEGDEMRKRAAELGESVRGSVAEGGVSRKEMDSFIAHITR